MSPAPADISRIRDLSSAELARWAAAGLPDEPWRYVRALREEARRHYNTNAAEARRVGRRAVELAELIGEPRSLGWGHRILAEALLYSGRMSESEESYALAAQAWRDAGEAHSLGQLLVGRIHVLSLLSRHEQVEELAREARALLEDAQDDEYLAKLAINLGNARFQRDRYADSLEEYDRALEFLARIGPRNETVMSVEINRCVALAHLDRDEESLELSQQLASECQERGLELLLAQVRMNAAYVHFLRAEFDQALGQLSRATDYFRSTDHPAFLATCLLNRAEAYHQLNLHREAEELTQEASRLFAGVGLTYDEALALSQSALAALATARVGAAFRRIRRARRLFDKEKNAARSAFIRLLHAEALFVRGRYGDAEAQARDAVSGFRKLGLPRWEAASSVLLARLLARRRGSRSPVPMLRQMLDRLPRTLYPLQSYRIQETLGEILDRSGRKNEAERAYRDALACLEDLRVRIPTEDSKIAFLQDKTHLFDRLLDLELSRRSPSTEVLFDLMERSRAQSLWDRLRSPDRYLSGDPGRPGNEDLERARHRLSWLHTRLSRLELGSQEDRVHAGELKGRLAEAEVAYSRMLRRHGERSPSPSGPTSTDHTDGSRLRRLQRSLPAGWGWVSYHLAPGRSLAILVTREGARWRALDPYLDVRVRALCDRLDFQWGAAALTSLRGAPRPVEETEARTATPVLVGAREISPLVPGAVRSEESGRLDPMWLLQESTDGILRELHDLLWAPLRELDPPAGLSWIISPHGPVHRVPFQALRSDDGYLVERADICVSPSARIWAELPRAVLATEAKSAFVAGVPNVQLPAVEREVALVARQLSRLEAEAVLAPTRDDFARMAPRAEIVHVAAHGSLRKDNPAYSYVELADGPLYVHDLLHLRLPNSTVILTACSSARGSALAGDEWIGLAQGFLKAGAATVVASLWPIQDEPTVELMDRFYAEFTAGSPAPVAMGTAMRALLRSRPHPWHWASFAVLGGIR